MSVSLPPLPAPPRADTLALDPPEYYRQLEAYSDALEARVTTLNALAVAACG